MNHFTTAITTFSTASAIVLGGLFFAPAPIVPPGPPTTAVPVELQERNQTPLRDGEVTTTAYRVEYRNGVASAGASVSTTSKASFNAHLADGEYLLKTVVNTGTGLLSVQDTDGTATAPTGSGCGNLYDCTWIVVSNNTWSIKVGGAQTHSVARFEFDRPTPVPTTSGVQVPTTPPTRVAVPDTPAITTPAASNTQTITFSVQDETNGLENSTPIEGAMTVVTYTDATTQVPYVIAARTAPDGTVSHTFPQHPYTISVILPAGYEQSYMPDLGPHQPDVKDDQYHYLFLGKRTGPITIEPRTQVADVTGQEPADALPAQPVDSTPAVTQPAPTTPQPVVTQPEPVVTQPEPTETVPEPVVTVPEPVTTVPASNLGCDESNDPEVSALLWTNDGAIRWMEDGEMITLYPEAGMNPVEVCEAAYHRLTELGVDIDFYTVKWK